MIVSKDLFRPQAASDLISENHHFFSGHTVCLCSVFVYVLQKVNTVYNMCEYVYILNIQSAAVSMEYQVF